MACELPFHYRPGCSANGCRNPAVYKIAATWRDGSSGELKNYGLACEQHRDQELAVARRHHEGLRLAEAETVGPVELYGLRSGCRDADLVRTATAAASSDESGAGSSGLTRKTEEAGR
jgi:hypothetical protein